MLEYVHLDFRDADDDIAELDMRARRASMGPLGEAHIDGVLESGC